MTGIDPAAERRQNPGGADDWTETHRLDVLVSNPSSGPDHAESSQLALSFQLSLQPNRRRAGFLSAVLEEGQLPIVISDLEISLPATGLEVRTSGLWAEFVCETPLDHWSYGLEAFALAVEDPRELLGRAVGDRVPLGWELEFEAETPAEPTVGGLGYRQRGTGHGLLLSAAGEREIEGSAVRSHWWGLGNPGAAALSFVGALPGEHQARERSTTAVVLPGFNEHWLVELGPTGLMVLAESS